jgi:glycosyltransferase involved in cell wall biosynthesis
MWHFTGHCGIALNCERWKTGCGHCPDLNAFPPVSRDSTALEWRLKRQVYQHMNMHVVAPSQWLADQASQSILRHFPIHLIRHAIDTQTYQPQDQQAARAALDLPQDKHVLMFSANVLTDHIKGADLLLKMVRLLPAKIRDEMILLLVGEQGWELAEATGMPRQCRVLGYLREEAQKAQAYSASDVFVMPSRFEVQGLVALEALACGVPVVAFRVGGIPEAVRPGHSGMLAEPEDAPGLATAVATLLRDRCLRQRLGSGGRILVESEFSIDRHVNQYLGVYEQAIAQHRGAQRQAVLQ